ncbi:MAG: DNA-binding MarR family transcriptional regulator [Candidatus Azotimanducaceae bacterium]|jgi:DNA-binding MarR family transcriptional regulator
MISFRNYHIVDLDFRRYYLRKTKELKMKSRAIAELVFHLGRIATGEGLVEGLTAAQWAALRYFAQANRFSRTPSAFAAFHGTTRGTASQTIKSIEALGYLSRVRSEADRRSVRLVLTEKARGILANDPLEALVRATGSLPPSVRDQFANTLQRILGQVTQERGNAPFGTCTSCQHLESGGCTREGQAVYACGFTCEPLLLEELDGVCINFVSGKPMAVTCSVTEAEL